MEENKNKLSWSPIIKLYLMNGFAPVLAFIGIKCGIEIKLGFTPFITSAMAYFSYKIVKDVIKESPEGTVGPTLPLLFLPFLSLFSGFCWLIFSKFGPASVIVTTAMICVFSAFALIFRFVRSSILKGLMAVICCGLVIVYCLALLLIILMAGIT